MGQSITTVAHKTIDLEGVEVPHGYPSSSFQFRRFLPALADRWRLIAPDFPGFGYSGTPDRTRHSAARS